LRQAIKLNNGIKKNMRTRWSWTSLRRSGNFWKLVLVIVVGVIALRPQVTDWFSVAPPSPAIERLAVATAMTPEAQQIFYRQVPTIEPKPVFFKSCQKANRADEKLIAFGCYVSNGRSGKIALQAVSDTRFQGIMEVAAAHEMLHAAYERLSASDRDALTPRLKKAAARVKDRRLISVLKQYEATDHALFTNELHSHLGTELEDLDDAELEQHYRRYFRDRHQVVSLAQQSQAAFRKIDDKSDQLKSEIDGLEANLKQTKQTLKASEQDLESSQQNLDTLHANLTGFKAQAEQSYRQGEGSPGLVTQFEQMRFSYNEQVNEHNERVQEHQAQVDAFKTQINRYKQKVNAYNTLAREERSLLAELDANPTTKSKTLIDDLSRSSFDRKGNK
jgi:uncharacterized coiled-coil DUF342 family protein